MMPSSANTYAQFHGLEQMTKTGLVAYVFLLCAGVVLTVTGTDQMSRIVGGFSLTAYFLAGFVVRDLLVLLVRGVNSIGWLGRVHLWLDDKLFRFTTRSNRIIFQELVGLLDVKDRATMERMTATRQRAVAESVMANLAEDQSIFESLMQRGVFRAWIWYWIAIYGVVVFFVLTACSLLKWLMVPSVYGHALFIAIGSVAGLHLLICLLAGYNVILVTRRITRELIRYFHAEIITLLRQKLPNPVS